MIMDGEILTEEQKKLLLNEPDSMAKKRYPIHLAVCYNKFDALKILVEMGADLDVQDNAGNTSMHLALSLKQMEMFTYLKSKGANMNIKNDENITVKKLYKQMN